MVRSKVEIEYATTGTANAMTRVKALTTQNEKLGNKLKQVAIQAVGLNFALGIVSNSMQKLISWIGDSIEKFREFELRMQEVGTILDQDTYPQLQRLTVGVELLSIRFGQSTSDMAKGMYDILSAAFSARDALNLLNTATKASIAGLSTVRDSVDIFTTVLNTYGMSVEQATRISDILFQSVIRGKFQFRDLESSLGYVVPIAAQAGLQFEELMAALSTTTRHGLHLDMTSRGLALAIQNIINPTEKARKAALEYGIDMSAVGLRAEGLYEWFKDLNEATQEYGKTIISELIPNMRSLRVAMVLAGEEGLKGFKDDMSLLEDAAGRTNEALEKIMKTQQFYQKQLEQQAARIERAVGEPWGELGLAFKKGTIIFAKWIQKGGPFNVKAVKEAFEETNDELGIYNKNLYAGIDSMSDFGKATLYLKNLLASEELSKKYTKAEAMGINQTVLDAINDKIEYHNNVMELTQDAYNNLIGPVKDAENEMDRISDTIVELDRDIERLNEELEKNVTYGWGKYQTTIKGTLNYDMALIKAEQTHADMIHDINMGLEDETYEYKNLSSGLQNAVSVVRNYEKAQEKNRRETELSNIAISENNLLIMKIQLRGMMRRRGLMRSEERAIKRLRIANMQETINAQDNEEKKTEASLTAYYTAKDLVDKSIRDANEVVYQMKYNYDQQIADLNDYIANEKALLDKRKEQWNQNLKDVTSLAIQQFMRLAQLAAIPGLKMYLGKAGVNLTSMMVQTMALIKSWSATSKYQRGSYYVPQTQMAVVHKGETISPAGKGGHGGNITVNIPIHIGKVSSDIDIDKIAAKVGRAVKSGYMNSNGTTNWGIR